MRERERKSLIDYIYKEWAECEHGQGDASSRGIPNCGEAADCASSSARHVPAEPDTDRLTVDSIFSRFTAQDALTAAAASEMKSDADAGAGKSAHSWAVERAGFMRQWTEYERERERERRRDEEEKKALCNSLSVSQTCLEEVHTHTHTHTHTHKR